MRACVRACLCLSVHARACLGRGGGNGGRVCGCVCVRAPVLSAARAVKRRQDRHDRSTQIERSVTAHKHSQLHNTTTPVPQNTEAKTITVPHRWNTPSIDINPTPLRANLNKLGIVGTGNFWDRPTRFVWGLSRNFPTSPKYSQVELVRPWEFWDMFVDSSCKPKTPRQAQPQTQTRPPESSHSRVC